MVVEEIPVDPVIIGILVRHPVDRGCIEAEDLRLRQGKEDGGMGGDDELHIPPPGEPAEQLQQLELPPGREGVLRLVQQVQPFPGKAVLKKCHVGLAMGFDDQGAFTEIVQAAGIGLPPLVKGLYEMAEDLRGKEGPRDLPVRPFDTKRTVQLVLVQVFCIPPPLVLLPDMNARAAGDRLEQGGLAGPVLTDKKGHGRMECQPVGLFEHVKTERVRGSRGKGIMEEGERPDMHTCLILARCG